MLAGAAWIGAETAIEAPEGALVVKKAPPYALLTAVASESAKLSIEAR